MTGEESQTHCQAQPKETVLVPGTDSVEIGLGDGQAFAGSLELERGRTGAAAGTSQE